MEAKMKEMMDKQMGSLVSMPEKLTETKWNKK
jgi:hypothetical protein